MNDLIIDKKKLDFNNTNIILHEDVPVAIIKYNGKIYAFDNRCPHRGGSLIKGAIKKRYISCPLHHWEFNLDTGICLENKNVTITNYKVRELKNSIVIYFD